MTDSIDTMQKIKVQGVPIHCPSFCSTGTSFHGRGRKDAVDIRREIFLAVSVSGYDLTVNNGFPIEQKSLIFFLVASLRPLVVRCGIQKYFIIISTAKARNNARCYFSRKMQCFSGCPCSSHQSRRQTTRGPVETQNEKEKHNVNVNVRVNGFLKYSFMTLCRVFAFVYNG